MSDTTPTPEGADRTVDQPVERPAAQPVAPPQPVTDPVYLQQPAPPRPREARWWSSRAPLLAIAAALVFGCLVGGGLVAVGAFVFGDHGGHNSPDVRQFDRDRPGWNRMPRGDRGGPPNQRLPAPADTVTPGAPAPTAS